MSKLSQILKVIIIISYLAITVIITNSCDSQKRVTKALTKLEKSDYYKKTRSWPNNYTFHQYSELLDDAELRQAFYKKRKTQAIIAHDKKTTEVMKTNIETYQKTIDRLKDDRKFYKIYKLRSKEVELKIKEENKTKKALEKQKVNIDKKALRANKEKLKENKQKNKERQQKIDDKREQLEKQKKAIEKNKRAHLSKIKAKQKEIEQLKTLREKTPEEGRANYTLQIQNLENEVKVLQGESRSIEAPINALEKKIAQPDSILTHDTEVLPKVK